MECGDEGEGVVAEEGDEDMMRIEIESRAVLLSLVLRLLFFSATGYYYLTATTVLLKKYGWYSDPPLV